MEMEQLGTSDMWLTPIGFGAWAVGGGNWAMSWGPQDDNASIAAIHKAIDLGVNWIDTAAIYGLGHSEEVVGKAVKQSQVKPFIFTKSGMVWNEKREIKRTLLEIRREVEDSLRRLQVERIDLYQIHWPVEDKDIEEGWSTMADLKREGKVRHIGVSNFSISQMERCQEIAPITSLQPPYSMLNRAVEAEVLPYCLHHRIGVINYAPMHSGLLTRSNVQGAPRQSSARRLPPQRQELPGAPVQPQPGHRRFSQADRRAPWRLGRRHCDCVDPVQSRNYRSHRGRPQPGAGGGCMAGRQVPPLQGGSAGD